MSQQIEIPVGAVGAGSQPGEDDDVTLDIMEMPEGMQTFSAPDVPEPEEVVGLEAGLALLDEVLEALRRGGADSLPPLLDLAALDTENRRLVDQVLGEGEVSAVIGGDAPVKIQESVLAGVWRVHYEDAEGGLVRDTVEIGAIPAVIVGSAVAGAAAAVDAGAVPEGVMNALPLVTELNDHLKAGATHAINLSLLPQTEADLAYLDSVLGPGRVTVLSRGYGNCRITSTGTTRVWWVQYFNSQEAMILNTLEVTDVPGVACASREDLEDSAERLGEILQVYR